MKRTVERILSGLAAVVLLLALVPRAHAQEQTQQTIRVAFPTQEGMSFFGHSGKVTGYIPKPVSVKDIEDALTEIKE